MRERFISTRERLFAKSPTLRRAVKIESEFARKVLDENRSTLAKALWIESKVGALYTIVEGQEHLDTVAEHLAKGGVLMYFNHTRKKDPVLAGHLTMDHLTPEDLSREEDKRKKKRKPLAHVGAFGGLKHFDRNRSLLSKVQSSLIGEMQKLLGFRMFLVIQPYDKQHYIDHPERIKPKTTRRFNYDAFNEGLDFIKQPGHVVLMDPSGTRQKDGVLMEPQAGVEELFIQGGENVLALPVSFEPSRFHHLPTVRRVKMRIGKPVFLTEIKDEIQKETGEIEPPKGSIGKALMRRLARLLEEKYRGVHSN